MLDKNKVKIRFEKSINSYNDEAQVQREVSEQLYALLSKETDLDFKKVLEIGCGTGFLTSLITKGITTNQYIINDLSDQVKPFIEAIFSDSKDQAPEYLIGDIETISIPSKIDLVISSSTIQWINSIDLFLKRLYTKMSADGILAFSTYGPENFREISGLHAGLNYHRKDDIINLLEANGFDILSSHETLEYLIFKNNRELLKHIQDTGVSGGKETSVLSKIRALLKQDSSQALLTYHPIYIMARRT